MAGFSEESEDGIVGINVVPLVDIILVVLIIFMVTATFIDRPAIDLELPSADTGDHKERNQFSLLLGADGRVAIGDRVIPEGEIQRELQGIFSDFVSERRSAAEAEGHNLSENQLTVMARQELTMIIQADEEVSHGRVIHFIDEARKVGIMKYAFNVDPG